MKKLVILATKYARGWIKVYDRSEASGKRRVVRKDEELTDLIDLMIEEIVYGDGDE